MAQLFKEALRTYSGCFRYVVFAIFDDPNAWKDHNPQGNLQPFADVFGCVPKRMTDDKEGKEESTL